MDWTVLRNGTIAALAVIGLAGGASAPATANTLQEILDRGTIRIGVPLDVPPFGYVDENNQPAGFDIDLAQKVADGLGVELEMQQITGINRIPYLITNRVDVVISVMGATPERARQIHFSSPYAALYLGIFGPADIPVTGPDDIGDHRVGVPRGTTQDLTLSDLVPDANIVRFEDDATTHAAFLSGQVDMFGTVNIVAQDIMQRYPEREIEAKFVLRNSPAHMGVRQGEVDLLRWLDTFIFFEKMTGGLDELHETWLGEPMRDLPTM